LATLRVAVAASRIMGGAVVVVAGGGAG